jgi:hypothetical protein
VGDLVAHGVEGAFQCVRVAGVHGRFAESEREQQLWLILYDDFGVAAEEVVAVFEMEVELFYGDVLLISGCILPIEFEL